MTIPVYPSHSDLWDEVDLDGRPEARVFRAVVEVLVELPPGENDAYGYDSISELLRPGTVDWRYFEAPVVAAVKVPHMEGDF